MAKLDRFIDVPAASTGRGKPALVEQVRRSHEELDYFVRALSHDMSANFMLLENAFSRLKRAINQPQRPDVEEHVAHVEACLIESRRFLDDLVGLAKTGRIAMEPSRVDVASVLDEVLCEQRDLIQGRGVEVVRPPWFPSVSCNPHRLKQVLTNLVRNAVLHGCDPNGPRISISAEPASRAAGGRAKMSPGASVALRIHDNGPGIAPQFREEIFLPGRRLGGTAAEGSGMGLAIVRKIVEYYGGRVFVDACCQTGTAIVFSVPLADKPTLPSSENNAPPARSGSVACDTPHAGRELHAVPGPPMGGTARSRG